MKHLVCKEMLTEIVSNRIASAALEERFEREIQMYGKPSKEAIEMFKEVARRFTRLAG